MKKYTLAVCMMFILTLNISAQSTSSSKSPKWLSGKGFWVIESNVKSPKNATIFFYNNDKQLVYKELVNNKYINTNRLRVRRKLEVVLVQSIDNWERKKVVQENQQLVASRL